MGWFKQAWFGKGLIFSSRLEFKKALICIEKILQLNQFDSTAINIKKDLLFYLRKNEELERFKKDIFKIRLIDPKGLLNMVLTSDKGKLIGAVAEINNQNLFLFPGEFINPLNYKTDKKGRLIFNKKNVTAIGDAIIYKSNSKSQSKKREIFQKEIIFDKVVLTTDGILLGDVKDIKQNKLIIRHGECVDFRKFQTDNEKCIILPVSGIISIDDIIIYQLPELDSYLIHKNHDEQSFIDQYFTSDYPEYLKIKF